MSMETNTEGRKFDSGKLQWHLLVWEFVEGGVRVLMLGATKYAPENWKLVPNRRQRYKDAGTRHWVAYLKGEKVDSETGESHLSCMFCNLMFLFWMDLTGDDGK